MKLTRLVTYLDDYLGIREIPDWPQALNGLQVEGSPEVRKIALAVDACLPTIQEAIHARAHLLLVHHGLFWGGLRPLVGNQFRRVAALVQGGVSLYAAHLPLDAHSEVGNNHGLLRLLGFKPAGPFGEYQGSAIGVWARVRVSRADLVRRVEKVLGRKPHPVPAGPSEVRRLGVVTGAAAELIHQAHSQRLDTFLTGEGAHWTALEAEELGINILYAGHYATETVGVKLLGEHLTRKFGIETVFLAHPTGL